MEKLIELIASMISDLKRKDEKILELERQLDGCVIDIEEKDKKIKELTDEITKLNIEKLNTPLQPNPSTPWVPNQPWIPNQPTVPDWPYWPPYGPIVTYVGKSDSTPYFKCEVTV